jgi:plastocyanin
MSSQSSTAVGVIVAILIVGAIATLGYYQFEVAAKETTSTTSTATTSAVDCASTPAACVYINITAGASAPYSGYTQGSTTLYGYSPLSATVVIGKNSTVVWRNLDSAFHTATSVAGDPASFDSECLDGVGATCPTSSGGSTYQLTFTVPGTYTYHCIYHPWMLGVIKVLPGSGTNSSSATST